MKKIDGQLVSAAWKKWKESPEGKQCFLEPVSNPYLSNRLERAFLAGIEMAEELLLKRED